MRTARTSVGRRTALAVMICLAAVACGATGPVAAGSADPGRATSGPVTSGPAASGPAASGPAASGPAVSGSVASGSVAAPAVPGSPGAAPVPAAGPPPTTPVVVLDPGHNGRNSQDLATVNRPVADGRGGTKPCNSTGTATDAGYPEHAFTFDVATRVAARLTAAGVRVVLTRPDDDGVGPCVDVRGRAGEKAGASAVVSIHADGAAATGSGFHVAYSDPPLTPSQGEPSHALGVDVRDALRAGGFHDSTYVGRGGLSPRPDLAGLNLSTRPTVLVECANMRNPAEAAVVSSAAGRERYAAAVTAGILAFVGR